jgi:hypothetical protein
MSQRLGMADGRCFTLSSSSQLLNNYIMYNQGIKLEDNYSYRQLLQKTGPELIEQLQSTQDRGAPCNVCDKPLIDTRNIY